MISSSAARCTADGKTSFEDWPMLTSSLAWTPSPASVAITSFAFMFDDVPEPVWKTSIGNWSSSSPRRDPVRGGGDPLRLVARRAGREVGVGSGPRRLDPPEPACDGRRDRLARNGKFVTASSSRLPRAPARSSVFAIRASVGKCRWPPLPRSYATDGRRRAARRRSRDVARLGLLHLEHGRPAEVAALRTLGRLEVLEAVAPRNTGGSALEALDGDRIHARSIGSGRGPRFPSLGGGRPRATQGAAVPERVC